MPKVCPNVVVCQVLLEVVRDKDPAVAQVGSSVGSDPTVLVFKKRNLEPLVSELRPNSAKAIKLLCFFGRGPLGVYVRQVKVFGAALTVKLLNRLSFGLRRRGARLLPFF